ncbi:hypothetical protein CEXT_53501 [Caerostris extrusa]|uniref:Uncharacterized protein n=1 Tax=Caerostris extrusa TaxID=172846 RepID=A0AAV4TV64_CAEEX|nr:hypothetical protein CEXT_53501 [Caerostris extrusa]
MFPLQLKAVLAVCLVVIFGLSLLQETAAFHLHGNQGGGGGIEVTGANRVGDSKSCYFAIMDWLSRRHMLHAEGRMECPTGNVCMFSLAARFARQEHLSS